MTSERHPEFSPRVAAALTELQYLIASHIPDAPFSVSENEDPHCIYLTVVVDVPDMGEVVAVFLARMADMQIKEELAVYVLPIRPLARGLASLA